MEGILLIDKPAGWTSFDVVAKIRGQLQRQAGRKVKVGHAGTLDPLATGLLIVLVGTYTKRADEFLKLDKTYEVTMKLGWTSSTGDEEGEKTRFQVSGFRFPETEHPAASYPELPETGNRKPGTEMVHKVLHGFVGEIEQVPPAFSAIKVGGKRAYDLARAGKTVKLEPRHVTIYTIDDIDYAYPEISFTTKVSSGTYIRTLVEDIGTSLGTGAYTVQLRRTKIAEYSLANAHEVGDNSIDFISNK